jgi:hypothetical protein
MAPRLALILVPIVVGGAWTVHADAVKNNDPFAKYLTSSALRTWNFGTLGQRFDPTVIRQIADTELRLVIGPPVLLALPLLALALVAVWHSPRRRLWLAWLAGAAAGPLLFINLYYVHDYYLAAITPLLAGVVALGIKSATELVTKYRGSQRPPTVMAVMAVFILLWLVGVHRGTRDYSALATKTISHDDPTLALADELRNASSSDELAIVVGNDYDPSVLYYARRRGTAVPTPGASWPGTIDAVLLHRLATTHSLLAVTDPSADASVLREAQWFAPVSAHVYRMAAQRESLLTRAGLAATTSTVEGAALPNGPSSTSTLPCNGRSFLIQPGTTVRFGAVAEAGARVTFGDGRADVPVPVALILDASSPQPTAIGCRETTALVLNITPPSAG